MSNLKNKLTFRKILFWLLVFLLPTQLAYRFWPDWSFLFGVRVDYFSPAIYLTDLLVLLLVTPWLIEKLKTKKISKKTFWLFFLFFIFVLVNSFFAQKPQLAIVKWLKVWELFLWGWFVADKDFFQKKSLFIVPFYLSLIFFSLIGIMQFILQKTIGGPFYFLGERSFSSLTPGIALFNFFGKELLRPYSTFGHPNAMAGFFAVGLLLVLFNKKKFFSNPVVLMALFLCGLIILLSFSQGTWLSLVIVFFVFLLMQKNKRLLKAMVFVPTILVVGSLFLLVIAAKNPFLEQTSKESVVMRVSFIKASAVMITERPWIGVGLNNFILELPNKISNAYFSWKLQPVHNIFLLIIAETGLVGLSLFSILLSVALKNLLIHRNWQLTLVILLILLTGLVDHYWLTLQQNQLLFSLVLGLALKKKQLVL